MIAAILLIVAFQGYWLNRLYKEEWQGLQKETNGIFRDVVYNMQVERFKADTLVFSKIISDNNLFIYDAVNAIRNKTARLRKDSVHRKGDGDTDSAMKALPSNARPFIKEENDSEKHIQYRMMLNRKRNLRAPQLPDTTMLRHMAKAGIKLMVQYSGTMKDSTIAVTKGQDYLKGISPDKIKSITIRKDSFSRRIPGGHDEMATLPSEKAFIRMITNGKVLEDTLPIRKLDSTYKKELAKNGILIPLVIKMSKEDSLHKGDTASVALLKTDRAKVGLVNVYFYRAEFNNPASYLVKKISPQIGFSVFLVAFTMAAFIFLYRNLATQRRLTEMKNDFISNITHELKTPIATVNVAIEALRNFGGLQDPEKTKDYLDISALELQRLSLLVDKVLKFSLFENNEVALQKESFDLLQLIETVMSSMKLQFEKQQAVISLVTEGDNFMIDADKLHISSVIYNLLDNALKYSKEHPKIDIKLIRHEEYFELRISDNGVGIPAEYRHKIFEQFFRVPNGDRHNIKGYGLGLSYVNHIVKQHMGFIEVESTVGAGSTFIVRMAFTEKSVIHFDKGRKIFKKRIQLGKNGH